MAWLFEMKDLAKVGLVGAANVGAAGVQKIAEAAQENIQILDTLHTCQIVLAVVSSLYIVFKIVVLVKEKFTGRAKQKTDA